MLLLMRCLKSSAPPRPDGQPLGLVLGLPGALN